MADDPLEQVTPVANPADGSDGDAGDLGTSGTAAPPAGTPPTPALPDEAYKGMQRALEKEKARARELENRLQQVVSTPPDETQAQIVRSLIGEIAAHDPAKAQTIALAYQQYQLASENQALRNRQEREAQEAAIRAAQDRNTEELRETARAFGVDPDSALIDYGDPDNDSIAERLAKVRRSAMNAAAPATPVTPPVRGVDAVHNTQPATPPAAARPSNAAVTEADLQAAQAAYARAHQSMNPEQRAAAEAHMRDLNDRFAKQLFEE